MAIDLDRVQAIINRPHIVDLRDDGFTLMHPPACHPRLFDCEYNVIARNNFADPGKRGQYMCALIRGAGGDPRFVLGDPAPDSEGVPWNALVAELRAAREVIEAMAPFVGPVDHGFHDVDCEPAYDDDPEQCHPSCPQPALKAALAAYDQATGVQS